MRIALVCPYDWARPGGVRVHVEQLARQLTAADDVAVFAPSSDAATQAGVTAVGRPVAVRFNQSVAPIALSPTAGWRTLRALRAFGPDVVHVHEPMVPWVALAAAASGPRPVVGTFHAWSASARLYRKTGWLGRRVASRLAARVAVSPVARQYAAEALHLSVQDFRIVPNGVERQAFDTAEPIPELVDPRRPLLLFVGRLEPRKGLDVLLGAFLKLRASHPQARLCVVGDGPGRRRSEALVPASARDAVVFAGQVSGADKPRYHASADVFVAPNTGGESFGIVLLEAMAAGLPVVASDIEGFRAVVHHGREGLLVPPHDRDALARALASVLDSEPRRAAMAAAGRRAVERYAWPIVAREIRSVYEDVLGSGTGARP